MPFGALCGVHWRFFCERTITHLLCLLILSLLLQQLILRTLSNQLHVLNFTVVCLPRNMTCNIKILKTNMQRWDSTKQQIPPLKWLTKVTDLKQDWSTNSESTNLKYQERKRDITADPENVKTVIRYYQQIYPTKKLNFDDKDIFLDNHNLAK